MFHYKVLFIVFAGEGELMKVVEMHFDFGSGFNGLTVKRRTFQLFLSLKKEGGCKEGKQNYFQK